MKNFRGIYAALLTPFDVNGQINYNSLEKLVEHNINQGMTGLYVCGSTGESMLMSERERIEILKFVKRVTDGRCVLIAHVGAVSTDSAVRMAKAAEAEGYDAVSAVAPFYYSFSKDAIKGYYTDIMNATNLPMVIYNFPDSGGFSGMVELVKEFAGQSKLVAVKHTSSNLFDLERFKRIDKNLVVFNGFDEMLIGGLSMGADGGIGSTYNFLGKLILKIYDSFNNGDIAGAQAVQTEVNAIIDAMIPFGVFQMEKQILTYMGIDMGNCRKPFLPLSDDGKAVAKDIFERIKNI